MFDNLLRAKPAADESDDEIQRYLDAKTEEVENPLASWQARSELYPRLHRMALDYLSIPGKYMIFSIYMANLSLASNICRR